MIGCSNVRLVQRIKERKYIHHGLCFQLEDENKNELILKEKLFTN